VKEGKGKEKSFAGMRAKSSDGRLEDLVKNWGEAIDGLVIEKYRK